MNAASGHWDEVESLLSLSDATIHSQSDEESQDITGNELGAGIAQENVGITQEDDHEEEDEAEDQELRPQNQTSTRDEYRESEIPEAKDSRISSNNEVRATIDKNISDKLNSMNNTESNLQTNDIAFPAEKSSGEEENQEPEETMLDGGTEELPFVRSVKYLERHEIFRLFQSLAAEIVYQRPDSPLQFIVNKLERERQESRRKPTEDTSPNEDSQSS